jgi:hypothetical protein
MPRTILLRVIVAGWLIIVLSCGGGVWGVYRGLVRAPTGTAHLGNLAVLTFTEVNYSPGHPTRAYYTIWVALPHDSSERARTRGPFTWARRLLKLEVPVPADD